MTTERRSLSVRICVVSANLGAYDVEVPWVEQVVPAGITVDMHRFTDANFPPRPKAMTSALQCGIPKWFGHEFVPGRHVYLWVDASCTLSRPDSVAWFLERLGDAELLVFAHPDRRTVREEYQFIKQRMARPGERYLNSRYVDEWLDAEYAHIAVDASFEDRHLFASTVFMYRPTPRVCAMLKEVWFGKTRWHLHDQLYFVYAIAKSGVAFNVLPEKYTDCPYLAYVRNRHRKIA